MFGSGCLEQMRVVAKCLPGNSTVCAFFSPSQGLTHYAMTLRADTGLGSMELNKDTSRSLFERGGYNPATAPDIFFHVQKHPGCHIAPCPVKVTALRSGIPLSVAMTAGERVPPPPTFARKGLRHTQLRARKQFAMLKNAGLSSTQRNKIMLRLRKTCEFNPEAYEARQSSSGWNIRLVDTKWNPDYLRREISNKCPVRPFSSCVCKVFRRQGQPVLQAAYPIVNRA